MAVALALLKGELAGTIPQLIAQAQGTVERVRQSHDDCDSLLAMTEALDATLQHFDTPSPSRSPSARWGSAQAAECGVGSSAGPSSGPAFSLEVLRTALGEARAEAQAVAKELQRKGKGRGSKWGVLRAPVGAIEDAMRAVEQGRRLRRAREKLDLALRHFHLQVSCHALAEVQYMQGSRAELAPRPPAGAYVDQGIPLPAGAQQPCLPPSASALGLGSGGPATPKSVAGEDISAAGGGRSKKAYWLPGAKARAEKRDARAETERISLHLCPPVPELCACQPPGSHLVGSASAGAGSKKEQGSGREFCQTQGSGDGQEHLPSDPPVLKPLSPLRQQHVGAEQEQQCLTTQQLKSSAASPSLPHTCSPVSATLSSQTQAYPGHQTVIPCPTCKHHVPALIPPHGMEQTVRCGVCRHPFRMAPDGSARALVYWELFPQALPRDTMVAA